ncbi:MAG: hypothetical protein HFJ53_02570 [Clostridia bacterium]|jgi:hypothetical protein|nr:hypothetical protein [Clostridia bacterium]
MAQGIKSQNHTHGTPTYRRIIQCSEDSRQRQKDKIDLENFKKQRLSQKSTEDIFEEADKVCASIDKILSSPKKTLE